MRTIWNGSISFGLVNIPVGLALATKPSARQSDVSFRQLHRECMTPIKQKRWCTVHEREVERDEIVKGWEVAKGEFVLVEDADLEAIMQIDDSKAIQITRFVDASEVDPVYFDRTYYLAPASEPAARRPYVLLLRAMQDSGKAALGRFVRQGAEHLCLIRPKGESLALETMFLAEDVNSQAEIEEAVGESEVKEGRARARASGDREPRRRVRPEGADERVPAEPASDARGEARRAGDREARAGAEEAPVVDLMEALKRSVEEVKEAVPPRRRAAAKSGSRKRVAARKSA